MHWFIQGLRLTHTNVYKYEQFKDSFVDWSKIGLRFWYA